jgi:hypothetical protein
MCSIPLEAQTGVDAACERDSSRGEKSVDNLFRTVEMSCFPNGRSVLFDAWLRGHSMPGMRLEERAIIT